MEVDPSGAETSGAHDGISPRAGAYDVLMAEYKILRGEENSHTVLIVSLTSVIVAVLGAIVVLFSNACSSSTGPKEPTGCTRITGLAYGVVPLFPFALIGYLALQGSAASLRSQYLRATEQELRRTSEAKIVGPGGREIVAPASARLMIQLVSSGATFPLRRGLLWVSRGALGVSLIGVTAFSIIKIESVALKVGMAVFYAVALVALILVVVRANLGDRLWEEVTDAVPEVWWTTSLPPPPPEEA